MTLKVQVTTPQSARIKITPAPIIAVDVSQYTMRDLKLEELSNVDIADGLDTNDIVIYDETSKTWIVSPNSEEHNPDGGEY